MFSKCSRLELLKIKYTLVTPKIKKMNCPCCEKKMFISSNTSYEDMGMDSGNGFVHDWVCENESCNCEGVLVFEKCSESVLIWKD